MKMQFTYTALIPTGETFTEIQDNIVLDLPNNAETTESAKNIELNIFQRIILM